MLPSKEYVYDIQSAALAVVNCRELCGNEKQALKDWMADNRNLNTEEKALVLKHVERIWALYQRQAGVTDPISPEERANITKTMNNA